MSYLPFTQFNNIWYVSKEGDDLNSGKSNEESFLTITKAITESSNGDLIRVERGTYVENLTINKQVTIKSDCTRQTILQGKVTVALASGQALIKTMQILNTNDYCLDVQNTSDSATIVCREVIFNNTWNNGVGQSTTTARSAIKVTRGNLTLDIGQINVTTSLDNVTEHNTSSFWMTGNQLITLNCYNVTQNISNTVDDRQNIEIIFNNNTNAGSSFTFKDGRMNLTGKVNSNNYIAPFYNFNSTATKAVVEGNLLYFINSGHAYTSFNYRSNTVTFFSHNTIIPSGITVGEFYIAYEIPGSGRTARISVTNCSYEVASLPKSGGDVTYAISLIDGAFYSSSAVGGKIENTYRISPSGGDFVTIQEAITYLGTLLTQVDGIRLIVDGGHYSITDTIEIDFDFPLRFEGSGSNATYLEAGIGLANKPMFLIRSDTDFTALTFDGSTLANWSASDDAAFIKLNDSVGLIWLTPVLNILSTPPASPTLGDRYLIGSGATGAWTGQENNIAEWSIGAVWTFTAPILNNAVINLNDLVSYKYSGSAWILYPIYCEFTDIIMINAAKGICCSGGHDIFIFNFIVENMRLTGIGFSTDAEGGAIDAEIGNFVNCKYGLNLDKGKYVNVFLDTCRVINDGYNTDLLITLTPVLNILSTPPALPTLGDRYLIGSGATGAWTGQENNIAQWNGAIWIFTVSVLYNSVLNLDNYTVYSFNGTIWSVMEAGIRYNPTDFVDFDEIIVTGNDWNRKGVFESGFDFSIARDADVEFLNNIGYINKNPTSYLFLENGAFNTLCVNSSTWYKTNYTATLFEGTKISKTVDNKITFLSDNSKDLLILISMNVATSQSNRTLKIGIIKNGDTANPVGSISLRFTASGTPFIVALSCKVNNVKKDDYFEMWYNCTSAGNTTFTTSDIDWNINSL